MFSGFGIWVGLGLRFELERRRVKGLEAVGFGVGKGAVKEAPLGVLGLLEGVSKRVGKGVGFEVSGTPWNGQVSGRPERGRVSGLLLDRQDGCGLHGGIHFGGQDGVLAAFDDEFLAIVTHGSVPFQAQLFVQILILPDQLLYPE
jgi:hypothetical protein